MKDVVTRIDDRSIYAASPSFIITAFLYIWLDWKDIQCSIVLHPKTPKSVFPHAIDQSPQSLHSRSSSTNAHSQQCNVDLSPSLMNKVAARYMGSMKS